MVGIILLILALALYFTKHRKWSLLILLTFIGSGFSLIRLGVKGQDLTFVFSLLIVIWTLFNDKYKSNADASLTFLVTLLLFFLLLSAVFSVLYYKFTPYQVLQGGRHLFNFIGYYFIIKTKKEDTLWVIDKLYVITVLTSVLYIIQVLTGLPVLIYGEAKIDDTTGLLRYYNSPFYLPLFIYMLTLQPSLIRRKSKTISLTILVLAQLLTLGRIEIATVLMVVMIGMFLKGNLSRVGRFVVIGVIVLIPMFDIISDRFANENNNESEWKQIVDGEFMNVKEHHMGGSTMVYRFAWVYERMYYLIHRPIGEQVFGLGMISDSQSDIVQRRYKFLNGLIDTETDLPTQLTTPDIAYGNFITQFGFFGSFIIMSLWGYMLVKSFKRRNDTPYAFILFLLLLGYFIRSFSGSVLSTTANLIVPFLIFTLIPHYKKNESNSYRVGFRKSNA